MNTIKNYFEVEIGKDQCCDFLVILVWFYIYKVVKINLLNSTMSLNINDSNQCPKVTYGLGSFRDLRGIKYHPLWLSSAHFVCGKILSADAWKAISLGLDLFGWKQ